MKTYYLLLSLLVQPLCFAQTTFSDSTIYIRGNGLNNSTLFLFPNGTVIYESWCDICPTERSFGTYTLTKDGVFLSFTTDVTYGHHYYCPEDSIVTDNQWSDTLYLFAWNGEDFLIRSEARIHNEIELYDKHPDPRLYEIILLMYLRLRKKTSTSN